MTSSLIDIANSIAEVEESERETAEDMNGAISQFVQALHEQVDNTELPDGDSLNISLPTLAVQVYNKANSGMSSYLKFCAYPLKSKSSMTCCANS